jgi:radical SAM superfamily enzyme YgiQ (UPF0313 family)
MAKKPKVVLYQSQQVNQALGQQTSFDMLPLEMLHIAAMPVSEGYDVQIIDASLFPIEEGHRRAIDACRDADVFGTTAILGYMVRDGHTCAQKVRAAHPRMRVIAGGWFASCLPEAYLKTGVYDAICLGQGEVTFWEFLQAVESGASLESVPGLALWRDGQVVRTAPRTVVGWENFRRPPWHLIDIAPYRDRQLCRTFNKTRNRMPSPPSVGHGGNYFGITYFSSFGCPEPCPFCCSPFVSGRRWKAIPADRMLDDVADLKARWGFQVLRFHDANFGVHEGRTREFAKGLVDRRLGIEWTSFIETNSICNYKPQTLDLMKESGYYCAQIGSETSDQETLDRWVQKPFQEGDNVRAAREMHRRGIITSLTYVIGFPGEPEASMMKTLDEARRIVSECPTVSAHVFPFRPIPGSKLYDDAVAMGYRPPDTLEEWGNQLEYQFMDTWKENVPPRVKRQLRLYYQYASFAHHFVRSRRGIMERISEWRLRTGNYKLPVELKASGSREARTRARASFRTRRTTASPRRVSAAGAGARRRARVSGASAPVRTSPARRRRCAPRSQRRRRSQARPGRASRGPSAPGSCG